MIVQVDDHPTETRPYAINQVADSWVVDRKEILDVLDRGTANELLKHLGSYTKDQLKPLRANRETVDPRHPWPFP